MLDGQFGSGMDEMEVEKIMNSENIIGVFPIAVEEPFAQMLVVPEIVPALGTAVTVTIVDATALVQPPVPIMV